MLKLINATEEGTPREIHTYMERTQFAINDHCDMDGTAVYLIRTDHTVHSISIIRSSSLLFTFHFSYGAF